MRSLLTISAAIGCSFLATGCYTGSQFTLEAPHLDQPVSMTASIHNNELQVLGPGGYEELGWFSISCSGWSVGSPLSPNPRQDISDELNAIVKERGGNGITRLSIRAANNPVNYVTMFFKGIAWVGLVVGAAELFGDRPNKTESVITIGLSAAGILFLPTAGDFTIEGMVVRIKQRDSF
jgi:hypothetical protein